MSANCQSLITSYSLLLTHFFFPPIENAPHLLGRGALRGSTQVPNEVIRHSTAITGLPEGLYWENPFQTSLAGGFRRVGEADGCFHGGGSQSVTAILCRCLPDTRPALRFYVYVIL